MGGGGWIPETELIGQVRVCQWQLQIVTQAHKSFYGRPVDGRWMGGGGDGLDGDGDGYFTA